MMSSRLFLAAILAPLSIPTVLIVLIIFGGPAFQGIWGVFAIGISIVFSYVGTWVLGIPIFYWLQRRGWLSTSTLVLCGSLIGAVVWFLFLQLLGWMLESSGSYSLDNVMWGAALGAFVAAIFGLIGKIEMYRVHENDT